MANILVLNGAGEVVERHATSREAARAALKAWENDRASILLGEEHAAQFQAIRNKIGPSGLAKVRV